MQSQLGNQSTESIERIVRQHLSSLPFYSDSSRVVVAKGNMTAMPMDFCISFSVEPYHQRARNFERCTYFEACMNRFNYYLLVISLAERFRGKGIGEMMYEANERIAKDAGCFRIVQTPSGFTTSGETRKSYLMRRGWKEYGDIEVSKSFYEGK